MQDFAPIQKIFQAVPGLLVVLRADAGFSVVAASADYLQALHADAGAVIGRSVFELFEGGATPALAPLRDSLQRVVSTGQPDAMPVQRFEVRRPAALGGGTDERFWLPLNSPVVGEHGEVELIVHRVGEAAAKDNRDAIAILDSITEGFYTLDRHWRFDHVNREACRILGRAPCELHGQVVWEAYPGLEGTEIEARYRRAMHEREKGSFTAYYSGHERWYEITVSPAAEGISVFFRDVTAQKTVQAQRDELLSESERQRRIYETTLDSTPDLVCVFDLSHRALYANAALLKTWGVADARGKRCSELGYEPWRAERQEREIDEVVASRAPLRGEVPFPGRGGTRLYDYIFAPVLDAHGEVVAVAGTARDITERHEMAERLKTSQRLEAVGTLAGGVAHDFNNMLAAILVNVALAEQTLPPRAAAAAPLQLVHRAAERARELVRQILTFSRRAPKTPRVQSLQPLVDEAVALLRSTLPPSVRVEVLAAPTPLHANVDAAQFQQLVVNLCTNAWQALADERGEVRVSLARVDLDASQGAVLGLASGDYLRLRVADDGLGMDDAVRERIFEPFFTTKVPGRGTGLGLAVVHGVVAESGGAIRVRSRPGRGTVVSVYLPRAAPSLVDAAPPPVDAALPPRALAPPDAATPGHVLYVDDDEIVSLTAAALLSRAGYRVTCERDGNAALRAMRAAPGAFSAVVTDFNMPGMSGLAMAEAVRAETPGTPVIIVSGLVTDELQHAAGRAGVREVVFKEHMLDRLVDAIRAAAAPR